MKGQAEFSVGACAFIFCCWDYRVYLLRLGYIEYVYIKNTLYTVLIIYLFLIIVLSLFQWNFDILKQRPEPYSFILFNCTSNFIRLNPLAITFLRLLQRSYFLLTLFCRNRASNINHIFFSQSPSLNK
jgi:hypothetical protein